MDDLPDRPLTMAERTRLAAFLVAIGIAVAVVGACEGCGADGAATRRDISVARMRLQGDRSCSSWSAGDGLVVTAAHCCKTGAMSLTGDRAVPGAELREVLRDEDHDVCVLRGEIDGPGLRLAARDPEQGAPIWTNGWPDGVHVISVGTWSGRSTLGGRELGVASITTYYGSSGSPVLDARGRVVGLISALLTGMDGVALVAPLEWLRHDLMAARQLP